MRKDYLNQALTDDQWIRSTMAPIGQAWLLIGKAMIGVLRGLVSSLAFLIMALIISPNLHIGPLFLASLILCCLIFSFLRVLSALLAAPTMI